MMAGDDSLMLTKNIYLSYTVKVTDWDDESTISNVKFHKQGNESRFFSEQVNMYTNEKEMLVEMPGQRIIAVNNALSGERKNGGYVSEEVRKDFLDSCEVVRCEATGKTTKILVLKVKAKQKQKGILITEMRYEYDTELKKIVSVKTYYDPDYKLKTMQVLYREYNTESTYKFSSFKNQFFDKKGELTEKYKDYELVDSRDKKSPKSKSRR